MVSLLVLVLLNYLPFQPSDFHSIWWRLSQICTMCTNLEIEVFIKILKLVLNMDKWSHGYHIKVMEIQNKKLRGYLYNPDTLYNDMCLPIWSHYKLTSCLMVVSFRQVLPYHLEFCMNHFYAEMDKDVLIHIIFFSFVFVCV